MMVIEYWNVKISTEIICVRDHFTNLALLDYPFRHVGNLFTTALKLINTMQKGYSPPVDLGSKLLLKVSYTSCTYFNRHIFNHFEKDLKLEQKYELLDPRLILQYYEYPTYGTGGIFYQLQREYGYCVIRKMWNAISPSIPSYTESNLDTQFSLPLL